MRLIHLILSAVIFFFTFNSYPQNGEKEKDIFNSSSFDGLKFRNLGTALVSGRIIDFAVNPEDKSNYFAAVASGGVWKTTNSGTTWEPVFDNEGSYSIGCITMDPNNPFVIWVGTGENNSQRSVSYGDGVYKSEDGGKSWKNVGLKNSEHIGKIIIDPRNSDVVYVASQGPLWSAGGDRGLYKTIDGGTTWEQVLRISDDTGVSDIIMDPRNPDVLYASSYQRRRHVFGIINGGPECALYKSIDAGKTWNKLKSGLPSVDLGRIGLAVSPVNPDYVFAIVDAAEKKGGFFRSTDRGATWEKRSSYVSGSGQYYQEIFCDPADIDRIYSMDVFLQVTDDGGKTFKRLGEKSKHVDNHAMWIDPDNTSYYLVGSDGGIYESWDRGQNWHFKANLPVTQYYKVSVDNDFPFYNVYGGTQDNFSLGGPSRTTNISGILNSDWLITLGGDGFETVIDPKDPNIVYSQYQNGGLNRYDKKSGEVMGIRPMEEAGETPYRWNWDSPLIISPHLHTRLYYAANYLFRSDDRGNTWRKLSGDLTRQIDRNKLPVMGKIWSVDAVSKNASTSFYGNIVSLSESPLKEGLIYVGTDDGLIQVTEDGGLNWRRIEHFSGVPDTTYISSIITSQHDVNTVYAAFDNHKRGDFLPYILKSSDAGRSWQSIKGNLPERGTVYSLAEDHVIKDLLFAGTEFGIFFTIDGGKKWIQLKGGMPTIMVRDMDIQRRENDLVLGTFGRSFYILDDYSPLRNISADLLNKEAHLFPVKDSWVYVESRPLGLKGKSFQGESFYTSENPPFGVTFTYYLKETIKTKKQMRQDKEKELLKKGESVTYPTFDELRAEDNEEEPYLFLTIYDETKTPVRKIKTSASSGIKRVTWDFRYPSTSPASLAGPAEDNPFSDGDLGTYAMPGRYTVTLSKSSDGKITQLTEPVPFTTIPLGTASLPAEDRAELIKFQRKVNELSRAVDGTVTTVNDLAVKINLMKAALDKTPSASADLINDVRSIEKQVKEIQVVLSGDKTIKDRNENIPPTLVERIQNIIGDQWQSTSAPTQTQRDAYKIAGEEFMPLLSGLKSLIETDLKRIEREMEEAKAPYTPGRLPEWKPE